MTRLKILVSVFILAFSFLLVPSYAQSSASAKQAAAKEERIAKQALEKKIVSLYKKALSAYFKGDLAEAKKIFGEILTIAPGEKKAKRYLDTKIPAKEEIIRKEAERKVVLKVKKESRKEKTKAEKEVAKLEKKALFSSSTGSKKVSAQKTGTETAAEEAEALKVAKDVEKVSTIVTAGSPREALDEKVRYLSTESGWKYDPTVQKGLHFTLNTNANYDSNIYLTNTKRKADLITHLIPGVYAYYGNPNYLIHGFYDTDIQIYGQNSKETRQNQRLGANLMLFRSSPLKVMISDTFQPTSAPATSEVAKFVKRVNNNFNGVLRYDMSPKTSIACSYNQELQNYVPESYQRYSYLRHTVSPVLYWHVSPKTSLTAEYDIGVTNYYEAAKVNVDEASNYDSLLNQVRFGIEGDLTPKSKIFLKTGYQHRYYYISRLKNADAWVFEGVYNWAVTPKVGLQLVGSNDIVESTYSDVGYYKSLNIFLSCDYRVLTNLSVGGRGFYIRSDYPHAKQADDGRGLLKRTDDLYGAGAEIAYKFGGWFSLFATYDYKIRSSNFVDYNYTDNQFSWGAKTDF